MLTRKEFAKSYVDEYCRKNNITFDHLTQNIGKYIYASTCLGICMEELGLLDNLELFKNYLSSRGGLFYTYINPKDNGIAETHVLSMREMLSLLPEEITDRED